MKKLLLLAAVGGALAAAAPAQAGGFKLTISNGNGGGIVFANGNVHRYHANTGWQYTDHYQKARDMFGGRHHGGHAGPGVRQGFTYIPGTVRKIQQRTGGKVTDIVYRNGVYHVQGYGPRGRFNAAKADPYTGRLFDVRPAVPRQATPPHAKTIPALLRGLRAEGFSRFDRVDLQGHVYKVRGLNRRGKPVVITADARSGYIKHVRGAKRYNLAQAGPSYERKPWKHWQGHLAGQHYSHFRGAKFIEADNAWTDHYRVRGRDRHGKNVDLRVCAYTGNVLGWRDRKSVV